MREVSDEQWEKVKELLPPKKTGRPFKNLRHTFNGILWVMSTELARYSRKIRQMEHDLQMLCSLVLCIFEKIFEKPCAESDFAE